MNEKQRIGNETRRLLREWYLYRGFPTGCEISGEKPFYSGTGIPHFHIQLFKGVRKELVKRQRVQFSLTDESVEAFNKAIRLGRLRNHFQIRDELNNCLDRKVVSGRAPYPEEVVMPTMDEMPPPEARFSLRYGEYRVVGKKEIVYNDYKRGHLVLEEDDKTVRCVLTGGRWSVSTLQPVLSTERKPSP